MTPKRNKKVIIQINADTGKEVKLYSSIYQAARRSGINKGSISRCINYPLKHSAGGFKWKTESKEARKEKIITDLYNSKIVHQKVTGILFRNHINPQADLHEDCVQEVFMHLCKKTADFIVDLVADDPKRLIGLVTRIAVLALVTPSCTIPDYPNAAFVLSVLYASNLNGSKNMVVHSNEIHEEEDPYNLILSSGSEVDIADIEDENHKDEVWEIIMSELTDNEKSVVQHHLYGKKKTGRKTKEEIEGIRSLYKRIEEIITKHKLKI